MLGAYTQVVYGGPKWGVWPPLLIISEMSVGGSSQHHRGLDDGMMRTETSVAELPSL